MTADRICSILFYLFITAVTCKMACQIQPYQIGESLWICGQRTRKSFHNRLYLTGIFLVLFLISAFRFGIGNDYWQYTQTAHEVYVGGYVVTEVGFNWLVKLVYLLSGGEYYEFVFAIFAFATLFFFLKSFTEQSVSFSQSFFLFMALGLYFQTFNTVRYYLALSIALFSMRYVLEKDWLKFVFWVGIAALFHKSVLLVIPAYWIASFDWKKWQIVAGLVASAVCYMGREVLLKLALVLYPSYKNTIYLAGGGSWFGNLRILIVIAFYVWFLHTRAFVQREHRNLPLNTLLETQNWYRELRFYGHLNLLAFVTGTFFSFLPVVTRLSYYFGVSQLFLLPLILRQIQDVKIQKKAKAVLFVVYLASFLIFLLQAHREGVGLLPYRSWLFETQRYIHK